MSSAPKRPRLVFVSHSSKDHRLATVVAETLRASGLKVWIAPRDIELATEWHDQIGRALKRCDGFVVLLTKHAVKSKWVRYEVVEAISSTRYQGRIAPILLESCRWREVSWILSQFQWIRAKRKDLQGACRELCRLWSPKRTAPRRASRRSTRRATSPASRT